MAKRITRKAKAKFLELMPTAFDPATNTIRVSLGYLADPYTMALDAGSARIFASILNDEAERAETLNLDRDGDLMPEEDRPQF